MIHKPRFNKLLVFLLPAALLMLELFTACEKEVTKIQEVVVHDTITVQIISVDEVKANPDSIAVGGEISLTATVTKRPEAGTISFKWFAEAGTFDKAEGDTVIWKAPEEPGAYLISVHATDGEYVGVAGRRIGVGMYVPTATPYFVGDQACAACHQGIHEKWEETGHAEAWASLMESDHAAPYCYPCHAIGYEPEPNTGNSGYDESPILKFVNVQCENCHGPGSAHIASLSAADIVVSYDYETCGKCHEGEHHPYVTEWEESPHNFDTAVASHGAAERSSCAGCHEGVAAAIRLSGDVSVFYGGGEVGRPTAEEVGFQPIVCQACHESHSAENPGQLRTVADVPLVTANNESPVITEGGTGKLCMHCHHARRGPDEQIASGYAHFGPHANPQADMMAGKSAYQNVAPADFVWADPSHIKVQNSCKTCHLNMVEWAPGSPAITGHKFEPTPEACMNCHGQINSFDDIKATEDFDGDGTVEGVQSEVQGLLNLLSDALVADGLDTTGVGIAGALGDTTRSTFKQREAGWNYVYVLDDKSLGIHNPDYAVQLLQQSYKYLTNNNIPNAAIVVRNNQVVAKW